MALRVLIAVTHLLGAGHLTRAAAIGRALAADGHEVTLVSGGMPAPLIDMRDLCLVQLPPVRTALADFATLLDEDGRPVEPSRLAARRTALLGALRASSPHVLLTELFPFGRRSLAAEFTALLDEAHAMRPRPVVAASVRDILVAPGKASKVETTHALVALRYDMVLAHGAETLIPLDASWPVDDALRARLLYTGYVGEGGDGDPAGELQDGSVVVSGGSSEAGLLLYEAALAAAALMPDRRWRVLAGAAIGPVDFARLDAARPVNAVVERARPDFRPLLRRAAVFVGQSGYNTVMDIVATGSRAVLVPFERGRETEQRLRADALAARGLATVIPEAVLGPQRLVDAVREAELRPRPVLAAFPMDGAAESARILTELAARRPCP